MPNTNNARKLSQTCELILKKSRERSQAEIVELVEAWQKGKVAINELETQIRRLPEDEETPLLEMIHKMRIALESKFKKVTQKGTGELIYRGGQEG